MLNLLQDKGKNERGIASRPRLRSCSPPVFSAGPIVTPPGIHPDQLRILREGFAKTLTAREFLAADWRDPNRFDLVLNMGKMTQEGAKRVILEAAGLTEYQPTAKSIQAFKDIALSSRVRHTERQKRNKGHLLREGCPLYS